MNTKCLLIALALATSTARAEFNTDQFEAPYRPVPLLPPGDGWCYGGCGTVYGSWLRGWADVIYAQGGYLVNYYQAAILAQQARRFDLSNDARLIEFRIWKRALRESRLAEKRRTNEAKRLTVYRAAYELPTAVLDRASGSIVWPAPLRDPSFDDQRRRIDELFRRDAGSDRPGRNNATEIERETNRLITALRRNQKNVPPVDYLAAQKFLRGLKYEPMFRTQVF